MITKPYIAQRVEHGHVGDLLKQFDLAYRPQIEHGGIGKVWAFGLKPDGYLSYYIGLDWIDEEKRIALRVSPKIGDMDHYAMLAACLKSPAASHFLGDVYDIRADHRYLDSEEDEAEILPLVILHYLVLLEDLFRKPLKKGYVFREENLHLKMKGKVLLNAHMAKNVFGMRPDRVICRYQEYSVDCIENRLLHSAYLSSIAYLRSWGKATRRYYENAMRFASMESCFLGIGRVEKNSELHCIKSNPVYREYGEALRLAKLIYRILGYRERQVENNAHAVPPYIIDMAKLFELYVYALLSKAVGADIGYQVHGVGGGIVDFLDYRRKLVVDAKYKPIYETSFDMDNMRQVAGYARNTALLAKLGVEDKDRVVDCLIIYPEMGASALSQDVYEDWNARPIEQYYRIYKLGVTLPLKDEA